MEKSFYFKLLQYIYDNGGINYYSDIVTVLAEQYPYNYDYGLFDRISRIRVLLDQIQDSGFIVYKIVEVYNQNYPESLPSGYEISAYLTPNGFQFLSNKKRDDSTVITNENITKYSKSQKNMAIVSTIALALSTVYLVATYYKDDSKVQLLTYRLLQRQEQLLKSMHKSQKGIDSSLSIMEKKTLPKKS